MKKLILLVVMLNFGFIVSAQTWKAPVYRIDGKPKMKTVKLKSGISMEIGRLLIDSDTLKENKYLYGNFKGVIGDTLQMNLRKIRIHSVYTNGTRIESSIPAKSFIVPAPDSTYKMNVSLNDIDILLYRNTLFAWIYDTDDFVLYGSLFLLFASPFICYDYKNQTFNAENYQKWALGSTIGIFTGLTMMFLESGSKRKVQFHSSWPNTKAKVWSFENERRQTP
ncbi:MAG: hypothetical protein IH598_13715 [Bacteroidales bacterium]|nr:hypothetical protein [Bacteroidales bacterium]